MTKIYTKIGDEGQTSLLGGKKIDKCCLEMEAIGEVDELNAVLGLLVSQMSNKYPELKDKVLEIQKDLFVIGANLAALQTEVKNVPDFNPTKTEGLENMIDQLSVELPELNNFVIPGGNQMSALSYLARTVCRRAERQVIALASKYDINLEIKAYLNRLSDLFFTIGRWVNHQEKEVEQVWKV